MLRFRLGLAVTLGAVACQSMGCGSAAGGADDTEPDAVASDQHTGNNGMITDAGIAGDVGEATVLDSSPSLFLDAPNDTGAAPFASGTATLAGPLAFPVRWAWMDPTRPASECGANAVASGGYAATAIALFEDDESSLACADAGSNSGASGRLILVEVATLQYVQETTGLTSPPPPTQALTPGVYTIVNEGENDENLCSFPVSTPTAVLEVEQFGLDDAQEIAVSGTVTIDSVGPRSIEGTFSVLLGGPYGQTEGGPGQPLSGRFNAAVCP